MLVNLKSILADAKKNNYGVGFYNTIDTDMLDAAIGAAEEMRSSIIIGTAEVLLPFGELKLIAPSILERAARASVPVAVHFDHGLTFERCMEALKLGFTSVMFDGSTGTNEENIRQTREIVKIAHSMGATVEGEIGHVGVANIADNDKVDMYTTVEEATEFISETNVDALAVSIGSAHGKYITKPKLDLERLSQISSAVETPLVLHGGSGLSDDDFKNCIAKGIYKINIFTDLCVAGENAMKAALNEGMGYLEVRNKKVEAMKETVMHKMKLFGSDNRY